MTAASMSSAVQSTKQLAEHLGLSRWTVSRVLNGHPDVNKKTAARVLAAVEDLGFAPNVLAQSLRKGSTRLVGVVLPDLLSFNLTAKLERAQELLEEKGYQTLFSIVHRSKAGRSSALQQFSSMRVAGLITFAADWPEDDPWVKRLMVERVPVVHVDPMHSAYGQVVRTDREKAMVQVLKHLHEGSHRSILVVGVNTAGLYGRQRIKGLKAGCLELGMVWERDLRFLEDRLRESESDIAFGHRMAQKIAQARKHPDAVIALNDEIAFGLLRGFKDQGIKVPEDLSVVGYDNEELSLFSDPPLTTVDARVDDLTEQAVEMLFENRKKQGEVRFMPKLIVRESSSPIRKRKRKVV